MSGRICSLVFAAHEVPSNLLELGFQRIRLLPCLRPKGWRVGMVPVSLGVRSQVQNRWTHQEPSYFCSSNKVSSPLKNMHTRPLPESLEKPVRTFVMLWLGLGTAEGWSGQGEIVVGKTVSLLWAHPTSALRGLSPGASYPRFSEFPLAPQ